MRQMLVKAFVLCIHLTIVLPYTTTRPTPPWTTTRSVGVITRSRNRSGYGEACNKTLRCKSQSWLSCDQEQALCQCSKPDEMIFEESKGKCVSLIGERCKYEVAEGDEETKLFEVVDCVEGAVCGSDGICKCPPSFFEDLDQNKCVPLKKFGQNCSSDLECEQHQSFSCIQGVCSCSNPQKTIYDIRHRCRIRIGGDCLKMSQLLTIPKSISDNMVEQLLCVTGSSCNRHTKKCSCPFGKFGNNQTNSCLELYGKGQFCMVSEECESEKMLACVNNRCECDPLIAIDKQDVYNFDYFKNLQNDPHSVPSGDICLGKVGTDCRESQGRLYPSSSSEDIYSRIDNGKYCIKDATCNARVCECKSGTEQTEDGLCGLPYDGLCSLSLPCGEQYVCTSVKNISGMRCQCPNPFQQYYEHETSKCRGFVGSACDPQEVHSCTENAKCVATEEGENFVCECGSDFLENLNKMCDIPHNQECNSSRSICDQEAGLVCRIPRKKDNSPYTTQVCSCPNVVDIYEPLIRKCTTPLGIFCKIDGDCVGNSICKKRNEKEGRCMCLQKWDKMVKRGDEMF